MSVRTPFSTVAGIAGVLVLAGGWLVLAENAAGQSPRVRLVTADAADVARVMCAVDRALGGARAVGHVLLSAPLRTFDNPAEVVRVAAYSITVIREDGTCATLSSTQAVPVGDAGALRASVGRSAGGAAATYNLLIEPIAGLNWGTIAKADNLRVELSAE